MIAIAVAVIVLVNRNTTPQTTTGATSANTYQSKLQSAFAPVLASNAKLSTALTGIDGSQSSLTTARTAAAAAGQAITAAHGAIGVLNAPANQASLSQQAAQALTQDGSYVQAVSSTLSDPTGNGAANLQTLAANTQSAFIAMGSAAAGANVSGTGNLLSWVTGATNASKTAATPKTQTVVVNNASTPAASPGGSVESSDSTECGDSGVFVNSSTTSCGFAANVQSSYFSDGDSGDASVVATSPATGNTYDMTCVADGDGNITCTGGIDASVTFSE